MPAAPADLRDDRLVVAEALVALALIAVITGWTVRALVSTTERRE